MLPAFPAELAESLQRSSVQIRCGREGGGSGIVWSPDGDILTNRHVLRNRAPEIRLFDGRTFQSRVVRTNAHRDLALLKIDARELPAAPFGDSSRLRPGEIVAAVGNPMGLVGAVTVGVIHAAAERRWISADIHLAPGNSGGPLANSHGRVVGVNTMIYSGLALAIPSNVAAAFARGQDIDRPLLGIEMRPVTAQGNPGLLIVAVGGESRAAKAGLLIGDVLLAGPRELEAALDRGGPVLLRFLRANQVRELTVALPLPMPEFQAA